MVDDDDAIFHLESIGDASKQIFLSNTLINAFEADFYYLKEAMLAKVEELKAENEEIKTCCDAELDRASAQLQSLGEERARLIQSNHELHAKYDDLNRIFHEMKNKYDEEYRDLVVNYNSLQGKYDEQLDIDQSLKIEYEEYKNQCDKSISKYIANSVNDRSKIDKLAKEMDELKELLQQLIPREKELSKQLLQKDDELDLLKSEYEAKESRLNRQNVIALTELESKIIDLERKLNRSIDVETSLRGNNAAMNQYIDTLKSQLEQRDLINVKIERSYLNLSSYLNSKSQQTIDAAVSINSVYSSASTDVFELILQHEKQQQSENESKVNGLKTQLEEALIEKDSYNTKVNELQSLVNEYMTQLRTSMESEKQLQLAAANREMNYNTLVGENAKLQTNITQLLQFKAEDESNLKLKHEKVIENLEMEKFKLKDSTSKLEQLLEESNVMQSSLQKSVAQLTESLMREMDNNNQLTSKNELLQLSLIRSKGKHHTQQHSLTHSLTQSLAFVFIESEQSYLKVVGDQTMANQQIVDQYEGKMRHLESRLAATNADNDKYIQAIQEEIASFKSQVSYSKVEIEKLNKEIEKLKHEITEKEKEIGDMRAKYASARLPATSPAGQQEEDQQLAAYKQATDSKLLDYQQKITSLQEQLNESMEANTQHLQEISVTRQQQLEKVRQVVSKAVGNQKASEAEIQRLKQELAQLKTGNGTVAASSDNATILKLQEQLTLLKANYDLLLEENTLMKGEPAPFLY